MAHSRNRSLTEVLIAITVVCFLLGFVAVLCIGNYYRARKAMERQKQKRLARLSGQSGVVVGEDYSPRSIISGGSSRSGEEQRNPLLSGMGTQPRRRNADEDLLSQPNKPNIMAV
jgi:type II secretory pathway pseudopilin PulG